jgi:hypothetical protein
MTALRVRLTSEPDDRVCLESPYHQGLIEQLKATIPLGSREWNNDRKRWLVSALYSPDLLTLLHALGAQITDERATAQTLTQIPPMPEDLAQAFATLHLAPTAPLGGAEAMFKFWARHCHPDVGGDPALFRAANDAIQIIRRYLDPQEAPHDNDALPF